MSGRVDPFSILKEPTSFPTKPRAEKPVEESAIEDIARQNNFPSRQAPKPAKVERRKQRRYTTGRNQHLGIKATKETVERFYKAADEKNVPSGELLRLALDALEGAELSGKRSES
jgi:hypothetical protein